MPAPNTVTASATELNLREPLRYASSDVPPPRRSENFGLPAWPRLVVMMMTPPDAFEP